jgi:uncharacterized RDD family membrane protein YckC
VGVIGLGAAVMTAMAAYRREHPPAPKRPVTPPVPPSPVGPPPVAPPPMTPPPMAPDTSMAYEAAAAHDAAAIPPLPPPPAAPPLPPPPAANGDLLGFPRAAFFDRIAALVLDTILIAFVYNVFNLDRLGDDMSLFILSTVAYHVAFWTWKGTTLGGIILNLRVIRMDGYRMRFVDALVRGLSAIFSAIVVGLGFLWILRDPERQAWHDRIAGTYVLKVPRHYPL